MLIDSAKKLAEEIRTSQEYLDYKNYKTLVDESPGASALIKEYHKLQMEIQMSLMSGAEVSQDSQQRISQISSLLFASEDCAKFLLAEIRLKNTVGEMIKLLTEAADMSLDIPEI